MSTVNYSFERLQVDFDERNHIRNAIAQLKQAHDIRGCRVLELGSGTGANLAILQPDNEVLGIEGLADAAADANRRGINTLVANLDNPLPLDSAQYDWILCLDVLEHLLSPDTALHEAHRLLKPGGRLLVNVPNHFTLSGRLRMLLGAGIHWNRFFPGSHDWNNPHIRFFTQGSIRELLSSSGFRLVSDLSPIAPAVPMSHQMRQLHLQALIHWLAKRSPSLFCGGFFLLAERVSAQ